MLTFLVCVRSASNLSSDVNFLMGFGAVPRLPNGFFHFFPVGIRSMSVSLSTHHICYASVAHLLGYLLHSCLFLKTHVQISPNFLYIIPVVVAWFSSVSCVIRYVVSVLWMTSCFHVIEQMGQNPRRRVCLVQFARW